MSDRISELQDELSVRWRAGDYLDLARPFTLLAPTLGFIAGGIIALFVPFADGYHPALTYIFPIAVGALSAALLNAASNTINQIFDLEIDKINKPMRPLPSGRIKKFKAWIFALLCYGASFGLAILVPNRQFLFIVLLTAFLTYAYSGPPFRTKRFGWGANLTIAIPRGMLVLVAGWSAVRSIWHPEPWFIGLILGLFVFGAATTKDFSDIEGDEANGVRTLPIIYGVRTAVYLIAPFFVIPFMLIPYGLLFGLMSGPQVPLSMLSFILAAYGCFVLFLILRDPEKLATEANHVSWKHMYLLLVLAQVGTALCYLFPDTQGAAAVAPPPFPPQ